ncbi:MAG: hypothetical protein ABW076_03320 [Candidatus Thiodiazotropha sp.]
MDELLSHSDKLVKLCQELDPQQGLSALQEAVNELLPDPALSCVLTRSNWHRLGGVVDSQYQPIAGNIAQWAEEVSGGDVDQLIAEYDDKGYFATRLSGKTHYFTAPLGDKPDQFIQLEIEELQEVLDRPLVERDWFPDSLEEFLDPLDYPRLEPEPIGAPYYQFRRVTPMNKLLLVEAGLDQAQRSLKRFFDDWSDSSANENGHFCSHWVLILQDYMDSNGDYRVKARPYAVAAECLPELPEGDLLQGSELANAIHSYDRQIGYPFAWFFIMLSRKAANFRLAEAVLRDQMEAYDYLPARDLKVLRSWEERPYAV